jgi:hypothetical protein
MTLLIYTLNMEQKSPFPAILADTALSNFLIFANYIKYHLHALHTPFIMNEFGNVFNIY